MSRQDRVEGVFDAVSGSKKYRPITPTLIRAIAEESVSKHKNNKAAINATKSALHQIGGAYFTSKLNVERATAQMSNPEFATTVMRQHASTNERLPILPDFYEAIFQSVGEVDSVLDIACGLNPLAWEWMKFGANAEYIALDIYEDMLAVVSQFWAAAGVNGRIVWDSVLHTDEPLKADVVMLLKTLPVLDQIQTNGAATVLDKIEAQQLVISYPTATLGGKRKGFGAQYEAQFLALAVERGWQFERFEFTNELLFIVKNFNAKARRREEKQVETPPLEHLPQSPTPSPQSPVDKVIQTILDSKKYGDTAEETVRLLAEVEYPQHKTVKKTVKAVRTRLHGIMAPYLGDPNYETETELLTEIFAEGDEAKVKAKALEILGTHTSTRERLPIHEHFFTDIWDIVGVPNSVLDLASALDPFHLPWMGLPADVQFHAYDIHVPRIAFTNHWLALNGLAPLAKVQDIALDVVGESADIAIMLKELPRFERNYRGKSMQLLRALDVKHLVMSFPAISEHGGRRLANRYRDFFTKMIADEPWEIVGEIEYERELVICVKK